MAYILDYCVISFLFLLVTTMYYILQRKVRSQQYRLYGWLVALGLCSLPLDFIAGAFNPVAASYPAWVLYLVNILCLLCIQASGPVFLLYTLVLTGLYPKVGAKVRALLWFPFLAIGALLLCSPFGTWGIFYLGPDNGYLYGAAHLALYLAMGGYLISSLVLVYRARKRIRRDKQAAIYGFLGITLLAMCVQMLLPNLLINTTANALALTMMYHVLESPSEHIDPLTRLFNRSALPEMIEERFEQNQTFSITVFPLGSFYLINHTMGIRRGDALMVLFARYLEEAFPKHEIIRLTGDVYGVLDTGRPEPLNCGDLERMLAAMPEEWTVDGMRTKLSVTAVGLNSCDYADAAQVLDTLQHLIDYHESGKPEPCAMMADQGYIESCGRLAGYEAAVERALDERRVKVYYQPIHDGTGRLVALEALCRITDPALGPLRPDYFIPIAEKNGSIHRLGAQVLEQVCAFMRDYHVDGWHLQHIGVNLSILQCARTDLVSQIDSITAAYGIKPGVLSFEITETEATASLPMVRENMLQLNQRGFCFLLEDFGSGYANFNYLTELPFACIKIDRDLLWNAMKDPRQMAFLKSIAALSKRLGLHSLCEGVETAEQAALLTEMQVDMQQGFFYSKALPPEELCAYAKARLFDRPEKGVLS